MALQASVGYATINTTVFAEEVEQSKERSAEAADVQDLPVYKDTDSALRSLCIRGTTITGNIEGVEVRVGFEYRYIAPDKASLLVYDAQDRMPMIIAVGTEMIINSPYDGFARAKCSGATFSAYSRDGKAVYAFGYSPADNLERRLRFLLDFPSLVKMATATQVDQQQDSRVVQLKMAEGSRVTLSVDKEGHVRTLKCTAQGDAKPWMDLTSIVINEEKPRLPLSEDELRKMLSMLPQTVFKEGTVRAEFYEAANVGVFERRAIYDNALRGTVEKTYGIKVEWDAVRRSDERVLRFLKDQIPLLKQD
ncbi:MAG: hypothetical protein GC159_22590 [Phycisphaera sp.]|nr:hypothetical protein [Phycisphaera sp.]